MSGGERGRQVVSDAVEGLPAGPALAAALAGLDLARLSSYDLYVVLGLRARQANHEQARLLAVLLEAARSCPDTLDRAVELGEFSADQLAFELHWSRPYACSQLALARALIDDLPEVFAAFDAGFIDGAKAAAFADVLNDLDVETGRRICARLLPDAPTLTLATLRERLRYHIKRADPDAARKQYRRSVANRQVLAGQGSDGTVDITGHQLPPHRAVAAINRIDRLARAAKADGDARTLPQLAADAFLDLLEGRPFHHQPSADPTTAAADAEAAADGQAGPAYLLDPAAINPHPDTATDPDQGPIGVAVLTGARFKTGTPAPIGVDGQECCTCRRIQPAPRRGVVDLCVDLATLMCLNDNPALIPGWGPVLADIARQVAFDQEHRPAWRYSVTDQHGRLLHHGPVRRRPTATDTAHVTARDRTCQAPGCRRAAAWCDQDHQREHTNGGPAVPANLCSLCRHHHRLRHEHGFVVTRVHTNTVIWDAANRRQYTVLANGTQLLTAADTDPPPPPELSDEAFDLFPPEPDEFYDPREGLPLWPPADPGFKPETTTAAR